jgi:3-hydroxypropanoate dehydrogenase
MPTRVMLDDTGQRLLFRHARTHSAWQPIPVDEATLRAAYDLMRWGPTSANSGPLRIVFVKTPAAKERLKPHLDAGNVAKTMAAPVTALFAYDNEFFENMGRLFPHAPGAREWYAGNEEKIRDTGFRNSSLQAAYFIMAARAVGLDCGPMSGFNAEGVRAEFFGDWNCTPNFICNLGYGDPTKLHPRLPRLSFEETTKII